MAHNSWSYAQLFMRRGGFFVEIPNPTKKRRRALSINCLERSERLRRRDRSINCLERSERIRRRNRSINWLERSERLRRREFYSVDLRWSQKQVLLNHGTKSSRKFPGFFGFQGFGSKKNPDPGNLGFFGILASGFFGEKIPNPRDLGIENWDPKKIPSQSHLCFWVWIAANRI